jgi:hypothetical protein
MKKFVIIIGLFILCVPSMANPGGDKSFLIIFNKSDLKNYRTSAAYIELSLMQLFETKSFSGNSDAAIIVKVPNESIDAKQLGSFFVKINANTVLPIEDFAFKIVDINKNRQIFTYYMNQLDLKNTKTKKSAKTFKSIPSL